MSKAGKHNFQGRSIGDHVVRSLAMGRELDLFLDDMGSKPLTPEEAFEAAAGGGLAVARRRMGRRWQMVREMPPVGLDCLEAVARGTGELENVLEDLQQHWDFGDSGYTNECGPEDSVYWAFAEGEWEVSRQIEAAWELHDCGFTPECEFPLFLRRVGAVEDALEMDRRIQRATLAMELRDMERLTRMLG